MAGLINVLLCGYSESAPLLLKRYSTGWPAWSDTSDIHIQETE